MIIISDETGCHGASYVKGSSINYIVAIACFFNESHLSSFVELARKSSRKYLGNKLRKWSKLTSSVKDDPDKLTLFLEDILDGLRRSNEICTLSIFLLNKQEVELNIGREKDKALIIDSAKKGYEYCFKRIFPFIKKWQFISKNWALPTQWFIDMNNPKFQKELHGIIQGLKPQDINLDGPHYIQKSDKSKLHIVKAIKVIDLIGGIARRAFDYYTNNCGDCSSTACLNESSCKNNYIKAWEKINNYSSDINLIYNGSSFWEWSGIIYHPINNRQRHSRFLGADPFTT